MQLLRANTEIKVRVGPFPDVGDGFTPQVDITLGGDEAELLKHNGVGTVDISGNTWASVTSCRGWYDLTLTAGNTDTEGLLDVVVQDDSDCLPVTRSFMVLAEAAWDSLFLAKDIGLMDVNIASTIATGLDNVLQGSTFALAIASAIWDKILTGSSHNIATSAGKRLRQIEEAFIHANGVIATVTNGHTFTLDAGAVATADYYIGDRLQIVEGTGSGQSRLIVAYTSGKVVTLDSDFTVNPDTSSLYEVNAADVHVSLSDADQAQGFVATYTNTTTITLDAAAVATTNYYLGSLINFTHGTGAGQVREITGYTNGRVVTMSPALATALDTTTVWHIQAAVSTAEIVDEWERQSQADPTGFHVNVLEVGGTPQTANDNGADINNILDDTATAIPALIATAEGKIDVIAATTAQASVCTEARLAELAAANMPADIDTLLVDVAEVESDLATVDAVVDAILVDTGTTLENRLIALKAETVLIVADTNELQTDWANGGRLDNILDAAGAAGDPWITELPGSYTAGQAGYIIPNIESDLETVVIDTAAIKLKTDTISGVGSITWPYVLTRSDTGDPIPMATVWATEDSDGASVLASGITDSNGTVVFFLDAGTVYIWRSATGYSFINPDTETVV